MLRSTKEDIVAAPHCASRAFRSLAVQVTESAPERWTFVYVRAKPSMKGGLGGNRSGVPDIGICFCSLFFSFFMVPICILRHFGDHFECFWVTFRVYFRYPWK